MTNHLLLILGNQLFDPGVIVQFGKKNPITNIFMREDNELCTYYRFHKHKIIFFLSAMRTYKEELEKKSFQVHYEELNQDQLKYEESLEKHVRKNKIKKISFFEIEDKFFEKRIQILAERLGLETTVIPSPMFLTTRSEFKTYLSGTKKPFMKTFYETQRQRLNILVDKNLNPIGGQWSFDAENRLALPQKNNPPDVPLIKNSTITEEVIQLTEKNFGSHPGQGDQFWLPTDRKGAKKWLQKFLEDRFAYFGPYEDAIPEHSDFVYHSVLTPFLNVGLLTPAEVIEASLEYAEENKVNIASVEGFVRQIIGWREFIRGIYQNYSETQDKSNFFKHQRKLTSHWYEGTTGIAPLDRSIHKAIRFGYTHHIERLMVIGSLMLILEIHPHEAHRWFMEMFIDSSDWVMGPNVYGMALFSDGGIFATKPYFCGSNYYRKMGSYKASESWCDGVDGLYWGFIEKHQDFFKKNHRMSMMVKTAEKMDKSKKKLIYSAAEKLKLRLTV